MLIRQNIKEDGKNNEEEKTVRALDGQMIPRLKTAEYTFHLNTHTASLDEFVFF